MNSQIPKIKSYIGFAIRSREITYGVDDIVKLKNGKQISADCIILDGDIEVNESLLTGEAIAVKKSVGDTLYAGSFVTSGTCFAKVNRVGQDCYIQRLQAKESLIFSPLIFSALRAKSSQVTRSHLTL